MLRRRRHTARRALKRAVLLGAAQQLRTRVEHHAAHRAV
jgi:hypothetical protein